MNFKRISPVISLVLSQTNLIVYITVMVLCTFSIRHNWKMIHSSVKESVVNSVKALNDSQSKKSVSNH